jgi:hypothetical protein
MAVTRRAFGSVAGGRWPYEARDIGQKRTAEGGSRGIGNAEHVNRLLELRDPVDQLHAAGETGLHAHTRILLLEHLNNLGERSAKCPPHERSGCPTPAQGGRTSSSRAAGARPTGSTSGQDNSDPAGCPTHRCTLQ